MTPLHTRLVSVTGNSLQAVSVPWRELDRGGKHSVFLTFEWMDSWWKVFGADHEAYLLVAEDADGSIHGIAPFVRTVSSVWRCWSLVTLRFMASDLSDRLGFVSRSGREREVAQTIAHHLRHHRGDWQVIDLRNVPEDSHELEAFRREFAMDHVVISERSQPCPYLPLEGTWEDYLANLPKKFRADLRRGIRRVSDELGGHMTTCKTAAEAAAALAFLFRHNAGRFSNDQGATSAFADRRVQEFHLLVAPALLELDRLECHVLAVDEDIAAVKYNFRYAGSMWSYNSAFDSALGTYGVGKALLTLVIERAFASGEREYDFLLGDEAYKQRWTAHARYQAETWILRRHPISILAVALPGWVRAIKRHVASVAPPGITRAWRRLRYGPGHQG